MSPTHADWEALRTKRSDLSYELALAVRAGADDTQELAGRIIDLTQQMGAMDDLINEATK